jgi:hypothetical protein
MIRVVCSVDQKLMENKAISEIVTNVKKFCDSTNVTTIESIVKELTKELALNNVVSLSRESLTKSGSYHYYFSRCFV